eukprot:GHVU01055851.1.p1 GENE.GHVU01055851.1~~GHVU01055851.1.p1  ORF type:complete len:147 (-),score=11.49 GHVU01055851.1:22-462(-)
MCFPQVVLHFANGLALPQKEKYNPMAVAVIWMPGEDPLEILTMHQGVETQANLGRRNPLPSHRVTKKRKLKRPFKRNSRVCYMGGCVCMDLRLQTVRKTLFVQTENQRERHAPSVGLHVYLIDEAPALLRHFTLRILVDLVCKERE